MAIPTAPVGATFPANETPAAYQTFIAANLDVTISSNGAQVLAYALGGSGVNVFVNNQPSAWAYSGPFFASPKIIAELVNSGLRLSGGFVSVLLPQLATTVTKQSLNAATPAQMQTALQNTIASFIATPLS